MISNSHAFVPVDLKNIDNVENSLIFDSDIVIPFDWDNVLLDLI